MQKPIGPFESFKTSDPDELGEILRPVLPTHMKFSGWGRNGFRTWGKMVRLSNIGVFQVHASQLQARDSDIRNFISVTIPLNGAIDLLTEGRYRTYTQGSAHAAFDRQPLDLKTRSTSCLVLDIDSSYLNRITNKLSGFDDQALLDASPAFSLQTSEGAIFWRYLFNSWSTIIQNPQISNEASSLQEMQDHLVSLLLPAMSPNFSNASIKERPEGQAACIKNAEEYICSNLEAPISIAELCSISKVHSRRLFRLFKAKHGIGPMAFLKQRRLEAVQRSLMGASCEADTVTKHAVRFGFNHLGQFASDYKRAFGESPSKTLSR